MKKVYDLYIPNKFIFIMITSLLISLKLFSSWSNSRSSIYMIFAIFFLLIFTIGLKPIIILKRIEIENGYLSIVKRFYKPLKINIAESLYQVVITDNIILYFRFRRGEYHHVQISPAIYKNGDEMTKTLSEYIKKHNIDVDVVHK